MLEKENKHKGTKQDFITLEKPTEKRRRSGEKWLRNIAFQHVYTENLSSYMIVTKWMTIKLNWKLKKEKRGQIVG